MTTETAENAGGVQLGTKKGFGLECPIADKRFQSDEVKQIWKECQEESFWYRALPLSLGSLAITGGLIYNGVWKQSKRFGPFPKLAVAGIIGYSVGKASYIGTCRDKFQKLGPEFSKGFGPGWGGPGCGGPGVCGHKHCTHVCQECKKVEEAGEASAKKNLLKAEGIKQQNKNVLPALANTRSNANLYSVINHYLIVHGIL